MYTNLLNGFNMFESKELMIVEQSSVSVPYRKGSEIIISTIKDYCKEHNVDNKETYEVNLNEHPEYFKIDIAEKVIFIIEFDNSVACSAGYLPDRTMFGIDGNVKAAYFVLYINPFEELDEDLIRRNVHHEINHCYKDLAQRQKLNNLNYDDDNIPLLFSDKNFVNYAYLCDCVRPNVFNIPYLTYYLFVDDEFNAMVDQLYGDLISIGDRKHKQYSKVLKQTYTYQIYEKLKELYQNVISKDNVNWVPVAKQFFNFTPKDNKPIDKKAFDNNLFKKWYRKRCKYQLDKMFAKFTKVACLYYSKYGDFIKTSDEKRRYSFSKHMVNETFRRLYEEDNVPFDINDFDVEQTCKYSVFNKNNECIFKTTVKWNRLYNVIDIL